LEQVPLAAEAPRLTPLAAPARRFAFHRVLLAEIKLLLKGRRWWWYLVAGGLVAAGVINPAETARAAILPMAWIWPVLLWSSLGSREARYNVQEIVFSAPSPVQRQLPAQWLAGFLLALAAASGVVLRLGLAGDWAGLVALLAGAAFIPSLALAAGTWSGGNKLFEVLYVLVWYLGPLNRLAALDFIGTSGDSRPLMFALASIVLAALAVFGRRRGVRD
jgi:hypothetical protein